MTLRDENIISAFTEENVERLTGLTKRQLRHWDRTGFFVPSMAYSDRSQPYSRLYSFRDLAALKVLHALRNEVGVSMQHLREVKERLLSLGESWSTTTLYVLEKRVVFFNSATQSKEEIVSGQGVLQIPLKVVSGDLAAQVRTLRARQVETSGRIEKRRGLGQPVIAGTRIPVANIKAFIEAGYTTDQIREEYPSLTDEDIAAAMHYDRAA